MTFLESELRKIVNRRATFIGNACYVRLSKTNRARIEFATTQISSNYDALRVTILNNTEGKIDCLMLRFEDVLGVRVTSNPNFKHGIKPHIWNDRGDFQWYVYHPVQRDYHILSDAIENYLDIFKEEVE